MEKDARIYVAGHTGLLGSAIVQRLKSLDYRNIILKTRNELDLTDQSAVVSFFSAYRPEYVFLTAAKVGSIAANIKYPADFITDNLKIAVNVISCARTFEVNKLIYFGSNCFYPNDRNRPLVEGDIMQGGLEPTNRAYAMAKLAGFEMCRAYNKQYGTKFIVAVPASMYGPNDCFDPDRSHVLASLISKFYQAKIQKIPSVSLWGDGSVWRELIYVDDVADASIRIMEDYNLSSEEVQRGDIAVNIGTGTDHTVATIANFVKGIVGYEGEIKWDNSHPNGVARKLLDSYRLNYVIGWYHKIGLKQGIQNTYQWYLENKGSS